MSLCPEKRSRPLEPTDLQATAAALAEVLVRKLQTRRYLMIVDEANHLDIEAMELLRYVYDLGQLGIVLIGTLRLYEVFTDGSRPASELEQLWSRVGICELLPGLMEWEARQVIQKSLGRISESTTKQILRQTGSSMRRLAQLLERQELREINRECDLDDLVPPAAQSVLAQAP